jgi:hypothetical protein
MLLTIEVLLTSAFGNEHCSAARGANMPPSQSLPRECRLPASATGFDTAQRATMPEFRGSRQQTHLHAGD